jgi:hypothetical protein
LDISITHHGKTYQRAEDLPAGTENVQEFRKSEDGTLDLIRSYLLFADGSRYDLRSPVEGLGNSLLNWSD